MSDTSSARVVPLWMIAVCWVVSIPIVIDTEYWLSIKLPVFVPFLILTIGLLRKRPRTGADAAAAADRE